MNNRVIIPKEVVEKYANTIYFMVDKDQFHMEAVEPSSIWIMSMGYEVDAQTLEGYDQHILRKPVDPSEDKFGTFKEKDMELHKKFTQLERKRKVTKMAEAMTEQMGFTKEAIKKAKEKAKMESKKPKIEPVPSQSKPKETKSSPTLVKSSTTQRSSEKGVLKKKQKKKITYVAISLVASEIESDEEAKKKKKKGEFIRVIRKPQSSGAQPSKKTQSEPLLTARPKRGRRLRKKFDKGLESRKVEGKYIFIPPLIEK